ncbi:MAG: Crp/Fnr family transcriptional regulator [Clostridia bacterium]|nr:Crp/Fnr family transcriptional regulator [Clostridia bacterium]
MQKYLKVIKNAALFGGIADGELAAMLDCLAAEERRYGRGEYILRAGDSTDSIGLMLSGSALIIQEDYWGNRNIIGRAAQSDLFAESFACSPSSRLNVSVVAEGDCAVLWLGIARVLTACPSACAHHSKMVRNLLSELASKNLSLNEKLTHTGQRTIREKALSYLSSQAQKQSSREFDIPFSRQQLADYLSVERSALSAELSKLRGAGVIDFRKNHFTIK